MTCHLSKLLHHLIILPQGDSNQRQKYELYCTFYSNVKPEESPTVEDKPRMYLTTTPHMEDVTQGHF